METKLEATERLRGEGRWEEASRFREKERQRLRAEGKPRKEAREESWRLMLEAFPPFVHESFATYMALADFPPRCCPEELRPEFVHVWRVFCRMTAICSYKQPWIAQAHGAERAMEARLRAQDPNTPNEDVPVETTKAMLRWAGKFPLLFLDLAQVTFTKFLDKLPRGQPLAEATRAEVEAHLYDLPELREAVAKHWPKEATR
jgi:hypothetical protein